MNRIAAAWQSYAQDVIPADALAVQRSESRRAFYAGAWSVLQECIGIGERRDEPDETGVALLEAIDAELKAFYRDVREGRA